MPRDLGRNNLKDASSPYLRQHAEDPVHWQEWNAETLDAARDAGRPLFVSVGYSTCHWCHVMARETFRDADAAALLNARFVPIKVDREERPDVDDLCMRFMHSTGRGGGWPLNVIMTPDREPFFAGTYFPPRTRGRLPGLIEALEAALRWYEEHHGDVRPFVPEPASVDVVPMDLAQAIGVMVDAADMTHGGFGGDAKFPPHSALLFLLHAYEEHPARSICEVVPRTLDAMRLRGLHDHLQGGFFRYCVDRAWTVPHFEKMLYDQAMALWTYAAAYHQFRRRADLAVAQGIVRCLEETFADGDLFVAALDADAGGAEGATYLWTHEELERVLTPRESREFMKAYEFPDGGHVDGKVHLVRKNDRPLPSIEEKLLAARRKRPQPEADRKLVTAWNALAGIGLALAGRWCGLEAAGRRAVRVLDALVDRHVRDGRVARSSIDGRVQDRGFLEDHAALLALATFVHENGDDRTALLAALREQVASFRDDGGWWANEPSADAPRIRADVLDHPTPSPVALAEFALTRTGVLLGSGPGPELPAFHEPLTSDFLDLVALLRQGRFHEVRGPKMLAWGDLPLATMQVRGEEWQDCHRRACRRYEHEGALLSEIRRRA